jgi:hypothetical protein
MKMLLYDEKRDFVRMQTNCKMSYRPADTELLHEGVCLNLSGAGILCKTRHSIELGRALEVRIAPENSLIPPFVAFIEVIRTLRTDDGGYRIAGVIKGIKSE